MHSAGYAFRCQRGKEIMSYIITAGVSRATEENCHGNIMAVEARILSDDGNRITFDIPGDFHRQAELTLKLCTTLINSGFYSFDIGHSY